MVPEIPRGFGDVWDPVSAWKHQHHLERVPESLPLLWRGDLWRWAPLPLYVYDRNEVAFSFRSGAEITFLINFFSNLDLCQWVINPYSNCILSDDLSSAELSKDCWPHMAFKLDDAVRSQIWFTEIRFQTKWRCLRKVQKFSKENLLFWLKYQITDYLLIHTEQITPSKGLWWWWWWFMALISERPYAFRSGWCFLALDSLNIANIFQRCLKQLWALLPFFEVINAFVSLRRQTYSCVTCFSKFLSLSWTVAETTFIYMYILCNCPLSFIEIQCDGFPAGIHLCRTSGLKCAFVLLIPSLGFTDLI